MDGIDTIWTAEIGVPPHSRIARAIKPLLDAGETPVEIVRNFASFVRSSDPKFISMENFSMRYSAIKTGRFGSGDQARSEWASVLDDILLDEEGH